MKKSAIPDNQRYVYVVACYDASNKIIGYACTRPYWTEPVTLKQCKVFLLRNGATGRANSLNNHYRKRGTWVPVPLLVKIDEPSPPLPIRYMLRHDNSGHRYLIPVARESEWDAFMAIPEDDPLSWKVPDFAEIVGGTLTFEKPEIK